MSSDFSGASDLIEAWKERTEKLFNTQEPMFKEFLTYSQEITRLLKAANKDISDRTADMQGITVAVNEEGQDKPIYSAQIKLDGDWIEEVPKLAPKETDVYWLRFKENVNKVRDERKEITNKAIEVAGTSISKVISPISFSLSDLTSLLGMITNVVKK